MQQYLPALNNPVDHQAKLPHVEKHHIREVFLESVRAQLCRCYLLAALLTAVRIGAVAGGVLASSSTSRRNRHKGACSVRNLFLKSVEC